MRNDPFEILDTEVVQNLGGTHVPAVHTGFKQYPTLFLIVSLVLAGAMSAAAAAEELLSRSPERGGIGLTSSSYSSTRTSTKRGKPVRGGLLNKLDERLSIIVTDKASTSAITFSEVMDKLADDMHVDKLTLFQRWWDTANEIPNGISDRATNVFCNSETDVGAGLSKINGFPYQCPRAEGNQATLDPFDEACPAECEWVYSDCLQSTALIWQISIAAGTAVSSGSYSPKTVGLAHRYPHT